MNYAKIENVVKSITSKENAELVMNSFKKTFELESDGINWAKNWDYIDEGSYKTVFSHPNLPGYVVKFCIIDNATYAKEIPAYLAAQNNGADKLLAKTYFISLDDDELLTSWNKVKKYMQNQSTFLEDDEEASPCLTCDLDCQSTGGCWNSTAFGTELQRELADDEYCRLNCMCDCIEIQEICMTIENGGEDLFEGGYTCDDEISDEGLYSSEFKAMCVEAYGENTVKGYIEWVKAWGACDIHSGNIGWRIVNGKNYPVIIDFMSYGTVSDEDGNIVADGGVD
jgi:hypothetical protein